jgi:hypothetical protein
MKNAQSSDVSIENHGSIVLFVLLTDASLAWVIEHVKTEPWQWLGENRLAVEPRYVGALATGLRCEGFTVS